MSFTDKEREILEHLLEGTGPHNIWMFGYANMLAEQ